MVELARAILFELAYTHWVILRPNVWWPDAPPGREKYGLYYLRDGKRPKKARSI